MDSPEPIPISALQHWCYCPRQCALIHVEQVFADNLHTQRGQAVHKLVDQPGVETRAGVRVERSLTIWNDALGLIGKADVVEFEADGTPYPVEYKHGSRAKAPWIGACDDLQVAAQSMCLEEMLGRTVPAGALFYATSKRRRVVAINAELRQRVVAATEAVRAQIENRQVPPPVNDSRCKQCSLIELCQPSVTKTPAFALVQSHLFDPLV